MYNQIESNKRKTILLIILFIITIGLIGYTFGLYYEGGYVYAAAALLFASFSALISYFSSDSIVLWASGAKPIQKEDNKEIYNLVENLCITAGIPLPKIYIIHDPAMNAFATGRDPKHASIALTTGIIQRLDRSELEGVIAHELGHVKNYDIRIATIVVVLVGTITLLADWFIRFSFFGGRRRNGDGAGQAGAVLAILGLIFIVLSPIFARLIQLAVSRKREFLADASGALLTRYPEALASALQKISTDSNQLQRPNKATAHLYFANPFRGKHVAKLFSTHPAIEDRIAALQKMKDASK
jgi:heat shock protein HtpX